MKASANCKWTTLAAIGAEIIEDEDGVCMGEGQTKSIMGYTM